MPVDEQAQRLVDLPIIPNGWGWAATGVGPDFAVLLLAADTPFDARRAGRTSRYRLYRRTVGSFDVFEFQHEGAAYTHVQPIGDGNFLLVTPGIYEATRDKRNGDVWNSEGRLVGKILLGDGINNVQTSVRSEVWVGYHDEGVYGAGEPGLACFDAAGKRVLSFADSVADDDRVPVIDDCYALNVAADDDVWVYYFKAFPLVRLVDKRLGAIWPDTPGVGAHAFAVGERTVLFAGDYGAPSSLTRYFPESGRSEMGHAIADGHQLDFTRAIGRADRLYLVANSAIWLVQAD